MAEADGRPSSFAAAVKIIIDAVQTTFGMAVMLMFFFGLSLVALAVGSTDLSGDHRVNLMFTLIGLMVAVLVAIFCLRLWRPSGLAGPPSPRTEEVTFSNSKIS